MTVAATVATAPLMAHHFGSLSLAALPANLLALPAVAPAMWLGMLAGMLGQVPAVPVEPLNWLDSLCLAYIAPGRALVRHRRLGAAGRRARRSGAVAGAYAALIAAVEICLAVAARGAPACGRPGSAPAKRRGAPRRAGVAPARCLIGRRLRRRPRPCRAEDTLRDHRPRRRPGRRDPARPAGRRRRCWSTPARPAPGVGGRPARARRRAPRRADRHPRPVRPRRRRRGGARLAPCRQARARRARRRPRGRSRPRPMARSRCASPRAGSCAPASCA